MIGTFALWASGTWWILLLIILGLWRGLAAHLRAHPVEGSLFLGMYSVATLTFGKAAHLALMEPLAHIMLWIAIAAWVVVAVAFLARFARHRREPASGPRAPSSATAPSNDMTMNKDLP